MATCGEEGSPPQPIVPGLADELGGLMSTFGVCAALYAREKTGKGQLVDTSLMGAAMFAIRMALEAPAMLGQEFPRAVRARTGNPLWNHYRCKDDKWLVIAALQPDRYWPNVCKALGMEELEHDPRFETLEARSNNCEELIAIMDRIIASKAREQWEEIFKREGVLYTLIQTTTEVINDPQAIANEYAIWFDHPVFGRTKTLGFPWKFSNTPCSIRREAPEYGQHAEEILLELGYNWEDITKLKEEEVTI